MYLHIVSRKDARNAGLVRFFTGLPCNYGHLSERNTKSSTCLVCEKERKARDRITRPDEIRKILKKSAEKNREKRREGNRAWREKSKDHLYLSKKKYREENRERVAASKRAYYEENREKCLAASRAHHQNNKEYYARMSKAWRSENKEKIRASNRNRKANLRDADGFHTHEDILLKLKLQKNKCAACYKKLSGPGYHADHIVPLALGGSNWPRNIQLLCPACNMSKGAKNPEEFYAQRGFLL